MTTNIFETNTKQFTFIDIVKEGKTGDVFKCVDKNNSDVEIEVAESISGKKTLRDYTSKAVIECFGYILEGTYEKVDYFVDFQTAIEEFKKGKTIVSFINEQRVDSYHKSRSFDQVSTREILYAKWLVK